jgi:hypothetical protein
MADVWAAESNQREQSLQRARKLFQSGRTAFERKDYALAVRELQTSFDIVTHLSNTATEPTQKQRLERYRKAFPATLAVAYHWHRNYLEARRFYLLCVDASPSPELLKLCRDNLPIVKRFLAHLEISLLPADATLSFQQPDGQMLNQIVPLRRWMNPGTIIIHATAPEHQPLLRTIELQAGAKLQFFLQLQKTTCPVPVASSASPSAPVAGGERVLAGSTVAPTALGGMQAPPQLPQPFAQPWAGWQIGLVIGGAVAGVALIGLGSYGIYYGVTRTRYVIK